MDLEAKLIRDIAAGKEIDIERALLVFSGLQKEEEITKYKTKIDHIHNDFLELIEIAKLGKCGKRYEEDYHKARLLFQHLWGLKPNRYDKYKFILPKVIDAQLSNQDEPFANCTGLSPVFCFSGLRERLNLSILIRDNHVRPRLRYNDKICDIETTMQNGFDFKTKIDFYQELTPVIGLSCSILINRGFIESSRSRDHKGAIEYADKALAIHPEYSLAYHNRGCFRYLANQTYRERKSKDSSEALNEALCDLKRAIKIFPLNAKSWLVKGRVLKDLNRYKESKEAFATAYRLEPELRI